jgi:predicted DNA-binding protein with PD1-like motif
MKTYAFRLKPGEDLKKELEAFALNSAIKAGIVLTCVGSLTKANLRLADENISKVFAEKFEITALVGTLSKEGVHLHISLADSQGRAIGGHLLEGSAIYTTAEIIIGELEGTVFTREYDENTGFKELKITIP